MLIIIIASLIQQQVEAWTEKMIPVDVLHFALRLEVTDLPERRQPIKIQLPDHGCEPC